MNTPEAAASALKARFANDGRVLGVEPYGPGRLLVIVKPNCHDALGGLRRFQGLSLTIRPTSDPEKP